jgi:hypothetical protein
MHILQNTVTLVVRIAFARLLRLITVIYYLEQADAGFAENLLRFQKILQKFAMICKTKI